MIEFKMAKPVGHFQQPDQKNSSFYDIPCYIQDKSLIEVITDMVNNEGWQIHTFRKTYALMEREVND
jgi:hypothetical protein